MQVGWRYSVIPEFLERIFILTPKKSPQGLQGLDTLGFTPSPTYHCVVMYKHREQSVAGEAAPQDLWLLVRISDMKSCAFHGPIKSPSATFPLASEVSTNASRSQGRMVKAAGLKTHWGLAEQVYSLLCTDEIWGLAPLHLFHQKIGRQQSKAF